MDLISSIDKQFKIVSGGHMGLVSGSQAPQAVWPVINQWLTERSL